MRLRQDIGPEVESKLNKITRLMDYYERALQKLIETYGNEEALVRIEYNKLKEVRSVHSLKGLYDFQFNVDNILEQLTLYGENVETPAILNDLERKINNIWLDKIKANYKEYTMKETIEEFKKFSLRSGSRVESRTEGPSRATLRSSLNDRVGIPKRKRKLYSEWCVGALREAMLSVLKEHQHEMAVRPEEFKPFGGYRHPRDRPKIQGQNGEQKPYKDQNYQKPGEKNDTPRTDTEVYGQNNPGEKERKQDTQEGNVGNKDLVSREPITKADIRDLGLRRQKKDSRKDRKRQWLYLKTGHRKGMESMTENRGQTSTSRMTRKNQTKDNNSVAFSASVIIFLLNAPRM